MEHYVLKKVRHCFPGRGLYVHIYYVAIQSRYVAIKLVATIQTLCACCGKVKCYIVIPSMAIN